MFIPLLSFISANEVLEQAEYFKFSHLIRFYMILLILSLQQNGTHEKIQVFITEMSDNDFV